MIVKQTEHVKKKVEKVMKDMQDYQRRWEDINTRGSEIASNLVNDHLRIQYLKIDLYT